MASRKGRGRLSSIDTLPEHADGLVQQAMASLAERDQTQLEILAWLNASLARLDPPVGPISRSAFNRHALRFSAQARRLREARETANALAERLDDMPEGDIGLMLGETIKAVLNDVLIDTAMSGETPSIGDLRAAAETIQRLAVARKADHDTQERAKKAALAKASQALDLATSEGKIDAAAAQRAREAMGFV
ncbi:MAG: phage protein Gp27 family protein [Pseudomonadota bacterium]